MQADGNLVTYAGVGKGAPWWWTGTNHAVNDCGGLGNCFYAVMQYDGNFVIYDLYQGGIGAGGPGYAQWSTGTHGNPGDYLTQQDDGNLVIYNSGNRAIWSSGRHTGIGSVNPCPSSQNAWTVLQNTFSTNVVALDDFVIDLPMNESIGLCGTACNERSGCVSFNVIPYLGPSDDPTETDCYLLSSAGKLNNGANYVAGVLTPP